MSSPMSVHATLMARGRSVQNRLQGRPVTYVCPPSVGGRFENVIVQHTSAEDVLAETDRGLERRREVTVNVGIGSAAGELRTAHIGGTFLLDLDGAGNEPWTIESFPNADAQAGFKRCLCVRPLLQKGTIGQGRRDR